MGLPTLVGTVVYDTSWSLDPYDYLYHNLTWAVNASTGAEVWQVDQGTYDSCAGPLVASGRVYETAGYAYALDATTGATMWASSTLSYNSEVPVLTDGVLVVHYDVDGLLAFNSDTGVGLWADPFHDPTYSSYQVAETEASPVVGP